MPLLITEAMNLFVGDDDPANSKHLTLMSTKLPTMEEVTQTHHGGGAVGEIEVGGLGLKALQITFKLAGKDPQVMRQFGLGSRSVMPYTAYGAIRDKRTGTYQELKVIAEGRLGRIEDDEFKRGELQGQDHVINEIMHYEVHWGGAELWFYDWKTTTWRVDGVSQNAAVRNILRIPGTTA